jgi:proteasome lid subunit RPN8/RPN11
VRFALLLFAISFDLRRAADDPQVLAFLQDLAVRGAYQVDHQEVAAFIVQDGNGVTSSVLWPHTANVRSERYRGAIPAGTVAIAHTHPLYAERPSRGDIEQAKKIGLPIYVITRWNLYVVDPSSGASIALIKNKNWTRSPRPAGAPAMESSGSARP